MESEPIAGSAAASPVLARVRELVTPIASDLGLDVYDVEQRGGTLRVTLDTPPGSTGGVTLDDLALASRLVSRELDSHDPVPGRYTLEVTSPGVERSLRTPAHFQREVGKIVAIRLSDVVHDERRITGTLVAADEDTATVSVDGPEGPVERTVRFDQIDRAKTVFEWGPAPKPGSSASPKRKKEHST
ncbi:MAG: ribosome maturation factor RimP [Ilumatobacteraceae bacterium]